MRLTEEQYFALLAKQKNKAKKTKVIFTDGYKSNKRGYRNYNGQKYYLKSLYEINYAAYLQWLLSLKQIKDWQYEPQLFRFPKDAYKAGPFYYKPDFKVMYSDRVEWHEVKGWMNPASKKKIKRFRKHFPDEKLLIIDSKWFQKHRRHLSRMVPGWETL